MAAAPTPASTSPVAFSHNEAGDLVGAKRTSAAGIAKATATYVHSGSSLTRVDLRFADGSAAGSVRLSAQGGALRAIRTNATGTVTQTTLTLGTVSRSVDATGQADASMFVGEDNQGHVSRVSWVSQTGARAGWARAFYRQGLCEEPPLVALP